MRCLLAIVLFFTVQQSFGQRHRLVPDAAMLQYAGSIGFLSAGLGYDVLKKHDLSFHYGHVPKEQGGPLNIFASKLVFNTWTIDVSKKLSLHPLDAGVMLSYHFGSQFRSRWPNQRYPDGYYWWKTSLRPHLLTQTSITLHVGEKAIRSLTCFLEFNTNELYLISLFRNVHALSLNDIIKTGVGIRVDF